MIDIKLMIDATRELNQAWDSCGKDMDKECDNSDIYEAMCEIDEAIINLVEKISLCVKAQSVSTMYGKSMLSQSHTTIVERNKNT